MHDESQVPNKDGKDASTKRDLEAGGEYRCKGCERKLKNKHSLDRHTLRCEKWINLSEEGVHFIRCKVEGCDFIGRRVMKHAKMSHSLSIKDYTDLFGDQSLRCEESHKEDSERISWQEKLKESDPETYASYYVEQGKKISKGILASPRAREVRRENFSKLGKSDFMRKVASDTAKKTSARRDIQLERAGRLKKWREENPEEFLKTVHKFSGNFQSRPEKLLFECIFSEFPDLLFKRNQQIRRYEEFVSVKSGTRQIDIYSKISKIVVEFDGIFHFEPIKGTDILEKCHQKDQELNRVLVSEGFTLIRVADDQYSKSFFKQDCLDCVFDIIRKKKRGLFLIGKRYEERGF